jgi:septum formation protein
MSSDHVTLILASASPRRSDLLTAMGSEFSIQSANIDESRCIGETPSSYVNRLAVEKASAVFEQQSNAQKSFAILAADTIVVQGETIFGKPRDKTHAFEIWQQLANSQHNVMTAVCLLVHDNIHGKLQPSVQTVATMVEFGAISDQQMHQYWATTEPADKAGAYAIQGLASAWVKLIHGSYSNVVGLPLRETNELLKEVGHNWL